MKCLCFFLKFHFSIAELTADTLTSQKLVLFISVQKGVVTQNVKLSESYVLSSMFQYC